MPLSWAEADRQFYASAAGKACLAVTASSSPAAPAPSVAPPSAALTERAVPQPSEVPRAQLVAIGVPPALPSTELPVRPAPPVPAPTPLRKNRSEAAPRKFTSEGVHGSSPLTSAGSTRHLGQACGPTVGGAVRATCARAPRATRASSDARPGDRSECGSSRVMGGNRPAMPRGEPRSELRFGEAGGSSGADGTSGRRGSGCPE